MTTALQTGQTIGLKEMLSELKLKQRTYLLYRVCELDMKKAMAMTDISKSTYNQWCADEKFIEVHRKLPVLQSQYKGEALRLLRKKNQLNAILLEGLVIEKIIGEVKQGRWNMAKTKLGVLIYDKLIQDLDIQPQVHLSWQDRLKQMDDYMQGGNDGTITVSTETSRIETEYQKGDSGKDDDDPPDEVEEEIEEGVVVEQASTDSDPSEDR